MIIGTVYKKNESPLKWPASTKDRIIYILLIPITHLQYLTIPNPMRENKENFYPLSLFMATLWIWIYSFVIVWFTYAVTMAYNLHFSILPMILYPFGIALRDQKKFQDMQSMMKVFNERIPDQRLSLAETFSGPIFQITGLMGFTWLLFGSSRGTDISFINEGIQY